MTHTARTRDALWALAFQVPNIILIGTFLAFPIGFSVVLSLTEWNIVSPPEFVGLRNVLRFVRDERAIRSLVANIWFLVLTVPTTLVISFLFANLLNRRIVGQKILRTMYYFPVIISLVSSGILWRWLFARDVGLINSALNVVGIPLVDWLYNTTTALPAVALVVIWRNVPLTLIIYLAALQDVPTELYEAADIDGARPMQKLVRITWPLLYRTTAMLAILNTIWVLLGSFDVINVMTGGGPAHSTSILIHFLYRKAFVDLQLGYAAFVGIILFLGVVLLAVMQSVVQKRLGYD